MNYKIFFGMLILFFLGATIALSLMGMINGWGLTPKSWLWILGSYFGVMFCSTVLSATVKALEDRE